VALCCGGRRTGRSASASTWPEAELAILEAYLPAQLSDAEFEALVAQALTETGATGMPQMGMVMKAATALVAGRAEGGRIAAMVKSALAAS
jgi:uncharacterized protein